MKNTIIGSIVSACLLLFAGCGSSTTSNSVGNKVAAPANDSKSVNTTTSNTADSASAVVKEIYDYAIKRNCAAIPSNLTDEFKRAVGTSKDELDALCDSFTDSGKIASAEIKGEELSGDSGKVKVSLTHKDGKKEDKDENVKKVGGKWLMDS
jgi:hypothetical protein